MKSKQPLKDWVKQFQELELSNDGGMGEPISLAKHLSWSNQKLIHDFISDLLSQTKSQIVEQILGVETMKQETQDEYAERATFYRNQLRLEIKEELQSLLKQ